MNNDLSLLWVDIFPPNLPTSQTQTYTPLNPSKPKWCLNSTHCSNPTEAINPTGDQPDQGPPQNTHMALLESYMSKKTKPITHTPNITPNTVVLNAPQPCPRGMMTSSNQIPSSSNFSNSTTRNSPSHSMMTPAQHLPSMPSPPWTPSSAPLRMTTQRTLLQSHRLNALSIGRSGSQQCMKSSNCSKRKVYTRTPVHVGKL